MSLSKETAMTLFRFEAEQLVPASLEEVWDFFATPANLLKVMPPDMELELLPPVPDKVEEGLIMPCRVKLFPGWHAQWVTEFTHVRPLSFFVDEQRFGPYRFWHCRHSFVARDKGTLVKDVIHYALWPPLIDSVVNALVARRKLEDIFVYRKRMIEKIFPLP
jgi:ligand-binding SRPBCC domain-containing protein